MSINPTKETTEYTPIITVFILMIFLFVSCSSEKKPNSLSENQKEALKETLGKFNHAFAEGNSTALDSMITENYIHTNGNAKSIGRKEWLAYLGKRENEIKSSQLVILNYTMDELEIEYHDRTAIVTGRILVTSKKQNELRENQYRVTHLWVYESGKWKRAGFHDTKIQ